MRPQLPPTKACEFCRATAANQVQLPRTCLQVLGNECIALCKVALEVRIWSILYVDDELAQSRWQLVSSLRCVYDALDTVLGESSS
jgi:hypothetical protein